MRSSVAGSHVAFLLCLLLLSGCSLSCATPTRLHFVIDNTPHPAKDFAKAFHASSSHYYVQFAGGWAGPGDVFDGGGACVVVMRIPRADGQIEVSSRDDLQVLVFLLSRRFEILSTEELPIATGRIRVTRGLRSLRIAGEITVVSPLADRGTRIVLQGLRIPRDSRRLCRTLGAGFPFADSRVEVWRRELRSYDGGCNGSW